MPTPLNASRPVQRISRPTGARLPECGHPLDADAVTAILASRVTEDVQRVRPRVRGRGIAQSWRVEAVKLRKAYATSNLVAVLADLITDPRVETALICDVLSGLALETRALRGECADAPSWLHAMQDETAAQGLADTAQWQAVAVRSPGALRDCLAQLDRQREATDRAILATRAELDRVTRPTLAD